MPSSSLLTVFKKYRVFILVGLTLFVLGGCGTQFTPVDSSSEGFFSHYLVYPMSLLIKEVASLLQGNYGIAIIVITISIRFVLMPFFIKQSKNSKESQGKMALIKPEMDAIKEKYKSKKSSADQLHMQNELKELYQLHNFNPVKLAAGCMPLLLQMPILIGFYYAIRRTPEIADQSFHWHNLGETDILFVAIAVFIYFIQSRVNLIGMEGSGKAQMKIMGFLSPLMIGFISLNVPAALPLYWAVSGLYMIFQTLIIKRFVHKQKVVAPE